MDESPRSEPAITSHQKKIIATALPASKHSDNKNMHHGPSLIIMTRTRPAWHDNKTTLV